MEEIIHIVCGTDENYALPLAVTIFSTLSFLKHDLAIRLYIVDGGLSSESRRRLERVAHQFEHACNLSWIIPPADALNDLQGVEHLSPAAYLRLFIPEMLPQNVKKVIYLDSDLLTCSDIGDLWEIDLAGAALGAVRDFEIGVVAGPSSGLINLFEFGLNPNAAYFNSGVLLLDLKRWRDEQLSQQVIDCALSHQKSFRNCDQDALNAILGNDWLSLEYRWNVQNAIMWLQTLPKSDLNRELGRTRLDLIRGAAIIHFTGPTKPWHPWSFHPATQKWVRCLLKSGWFTTFEGRQWASRYQVQYVWQRIKALLGLYKPLDKAR